MGEDIGDTAEREVREETGVYSSMTVSIFAPFLHKQCKNQEHQQCRAIQEKTENISI